MSDAAPPLERPLPPPQAAPPFSLRQLFLLFLRTGFSFGTGTGMTIVVQDELVRKRQLLSRAEFMSLYGLARVVPSGTFTAIAIALAHRYQGLPGTVVALVAMILPAFVLIVSLTVAYTQLVGNPLFDIVVATLLPAALAIIIIGAYKLAQEFLTPSVELALMVTAMVAVLVFGANPSLFLVAGGVIGALTIRTKRRDRQP